jgi:hypothetical protein
MFAAVPQPRTLVGVAWQLGLFRTKFLTHAPHTKIESTVRYLGVEIDDALEIAGHSDQLNPRMAIRS